MQGMWSAQGGGSGRGPRGALLVSGLDELLDLVKVVIPGEVEATDAPQACEAAKALSC
jgi:hypothetical protein